VAASRLFSCLALGAAMLAPVVAKAETLQTLYMFKGSPDGRFPLGLAFDNAGNLYGTTTYGGTMSTTCGGSGCGAVFKLAPPSPGKPQQWTETLYSFTGSPEGANPYAQLTYMNGALYGTTAYGGYANSTACVGGCGTVFKFDPATRKLTTIYSFTGIGDSGGPYAGLAFDTEGALYGMTEGGDNADNANGAMFKLTPPANGDTSWSYSTLYTFPGLAIDTNLALDKTGNIYATGRVCNSPCTFGAAYELDATTHALTTLHAFTGGADGADPVGALTISYLPNGAFVLYGTTRSGGEGNAGTVFALDPTTHALTTLYAFTGGADGGEPDTRLTVDSAGDLYGTTLTGGITSDCSSFGGCGVVFKLTPTTAGQTAWTETVLHAFTGGADGGSPLTFLALDTKGALYGTTVVGGDDPMCFNNKGFLNFPANPPPGCGVAFKLTAGAIPLQ
jgi:uncharacterized repeat protein (TIGR03803 family)